MAVTLRSQYDKRGYLKCRLVERWRGLTDRKARGKPDHKRLAEILDMEDEAADMTDQEMVESTQEMRRMVQEGECELDILVEPAFAVVREAARRVTGLFHYPSQIMAGLALVRGGIAEMATGEGKTLAVTLPAFVFALPGRGVHVATVNSYLAERDYEFVTPIFRLLGITCGMLPEKEPASVKRAEYEKDVTYGVGYEFGFDYLRDQLALLRTPHPGHREKLRDALLEVRSPLPDLAQTGHAYAIIDEVDSVLIDEAGSPLVISEAVPESEAVRLPYDMARDLVGELEEEHHFRINRPRNGIDLLVAGRERIHEVEGIPWEMLRRPWEQYVMNALRAQHLFQRDAQYVVDEEGKVVIIDEFTGRRHEERTWREGLHQAVEAKEGTKIRSENDTAASITRQRYFTFYEKISGLTGTAAESTGEFFRFFEMGVKPIPLNRPSQRKVLPERVFQSSEAMYAAVVAEVAERHRTRQPVLVGTRTIRVSEALSAMFEEEGIPHQLLTAKQDKEEADIVATAGQEGQVLIATNMAGRGTDIKLSNKAKEAGGLHVLAVERNESVRIDRQLIGRGARQGQPGSAQFFVSADDFLIQHYSPELGERMKKASAEKNGELKGDFSRNFDEVQERVERLRYEQRLALAERDKWAEATRRSLA